jgi:putative endonuclease
VKYYFVYLATNRLNTVIYTGVTNNLSRRLFQHREKLVPGFTSKYNVNKLVYFETFTDVLEAIKREKQIKAGSRVKKLTLITSKNPTFEDLAKRIP